jgi:hypothetical protein
MLFGYIAILNKPWGMASTSDLQVDAGCHLLLYRGNFSLADFANLVKPLGARQAASLPPSSQAEGCVSWRGMVTRCRCWRVLLLCF